MYRAIIAFCFLVSSTYGGTIDPNVNDSEYINYGKKFVHTGTLSGNYDKDQFKFFGASAVAIDDHHILTAAHVAINASNCIFTVAGQKYCISEIIVHEDYDEDNFGIADIAIGYSEKSFNFDFYPKLYEGDDEVGKTVAIAGYGFTGTFSGASRTCDGNKRAGSNIIDRVFKDMLLCSPSRSGESDNTTLEFLIASGDSGGPVYMGNELIGINSCVMAADKNTDSGYGDESGHTRISKFIHWIRANMKR